MAKTIKVRVSFVVEIDADGWCEEYGIERREVRNDVKMYIENGVRSYFDFAGLIVQG